MRLPVQAAGVAVQGRRNTCGGISPADGKYSLYSAIIVKRVDAKTRAKTSINESLRGDWSPVWQAHLIASG